MSYAKGSERARLQDNLCSKCPIPLERKPTAQECETCKDNFRQWMDAMGVEK